MAGSSVLVAPPAEAVSESGDDGQGGGVGSEVEPGAVIDVVAVDLGRDIDAYDRTRLLEDLCRTFSEAGINILGASCMTRHPMVKNRFVVEVGDTEQLKQCISRLRNIESVFDAYRITPTT